MMKLASFAVAALLATTILPDAQERTPQALADELLSADRAFATASGSTDLVSALDAMFAADVTLVVPGSMVQGKAAALDALRSNPDSPKSQLRWAPQRAGISADGQHGFTAGFFAVEAPGGKRTAGKYLSYWIKGRSGWRVAAYKRARGAADVQVSLDMMPPSLPAQIVPVATDPGLIARHGASLSAAEAGFSQDAQSIGLGPAFAKHGSADAINLGGPNVAGFVVGNEAIGKFIGESSPEPQSPLAWGADRVLVASSGDLGITFGTIRENTPAAGAAPRTFPYFTIWRRATPADPWKYIAE